jgi:hypothetical protein
MFSVGVKASNEVMAVLRGLCPHRYFRRWQCAADETYEPERTTYNPAGLWLAQAQLVTNFTRAAYSSKVVKRSAGEDLYCDTMLALDSSPSDTRSPHTVLSRVLRASADLWPIWSWFPNGFLVTLDHIDHVVWCWS